MSNLFNDKYKIESIRLPGWDYRSSGYYFVTICTKDRIDCLSKIIRNKIYLSKIGKIVLEEWFKTEKIRKNVILDEHIIMPNHFHGIIILKDPMCSSVETLRTTSLQCATSLRTKNNKITIFSKMSPKSGSLSAIIRSFKSSVSKRCHENGFEFQWQERFYERIIRDEKELYKTRKYIKENPFTTQH